MLCGQHLNKKGVIFQLYFDLSRCSTEMPTYGKVLTIFVPAISTQQMNLSMYKCSYIPL